MNTTVLSIQPVEGTNDFIVLMSIGAEQEQFTFTIEKPKQQPFVVVGGDIRFGKSFRFNQHISIEVSKLVGEIYKGKHVEFPADVGDFGTPEEAIALQKPFQKPPENAVNK
jgi:mitochondrial fission protein ELM1